MMSPLDSFHDVPARFAGPEAIVSILGHGITLRLADRMLKTPTLQDQLNSALCDRLGACPTELTSTQTYIATLLPIELTKLALRAGAVWHAKLIASVYEGPAVRALVDRIGSDFRDVALQDIALGATARAADETVEILNLPAAIARDGAGALVAWCEAQPREVGWRVLLRLRVSARPTVDHKVSGPEILERLVMTACQT
ncbi:MAG: hypothetical protein ACRYG8_06970 [Janthinobacterium lividum]